ncbi:MAG: hypothetical protein MI749_03340 [Desulfovibrionales bacterium]|nr:hypothetical protein [Desulfovibrionales bacterium]
MDTGYIFKVVNDVIAQAKLNNDQEIVELLDVVLSLGSSSMEILGAIRSIVMTNEKIDKYIDMNSRMEISLYIDGLYGR